MPSVIEKAQVKDVCPEVRGADKSDSLEAIIYHLLEDLCQNCIPTLRPILVVDGFDEPLENEREVLEKHLLEQFWRRDCVRIVIALRDEFSLSSHNLRRGEHRTLLTVFTPPVGKEQLQKRANAEGTTILSPEELLPLIPPYNWTNPGINTYLYETAKQKKLHDQLPLLAAEDLRNCWLLPIKEKLSQYFLNQDIVETNLKAIISQEDTWTLETFARTCGCSRTDASKHIQDLMTLSLVSTERQRYKVVDGIREIIRAEVALRG